MTQQNNSGNSQIVARTETVESLVRLVADAAEALAVFDAEMHYIAASPKWLADHDFAGPVTGRSHYELFPEIGEDWKAVHRRCLSGANERSERDRFQRARGGARWIAWQVRPWREKSGAIGGLVIASQDIPPGVEATEKSKPRRPEAAQSDGLSEEARRTIGARLASVRFRLDLTERSFAKLLGVPAAAVSGWESGRGLGIEDLRLIADRTDTSFEWLVEGLTWREGVARKDGDASPPVPTGSVNAIEHERIRPQRLFVGAEMPKAITSVWKLRRESQADAARGELETVGARPSALFLSLPGASFCSGARAAGYGQEKSRFRTERAELLLNFTLEGCCRVEQLGQDIESGKGVAVFTSSVESGRYSYQNQGRYLSVAVPATSLQDRIRNVESRLMQPTAPDSPPMRLLSAYVSTLMKSENGLDREVAHSVADHVADLFALLLGARGNERALAETRGVRAAQRSVIHEAIDAGAATPGFSAQTIAAQLGLSPRYVHFLLEEGGTGFGSLVAARRLVLARERLADPQFARMTIAEIAMACGFTDLQRFRLQFIARFGDAPSAFRVKR